MSKWPDALQLADDLETLKLNVRTSDAAAAELRRQAREIERLHARVYELEAALRQEDKT